VSYEDITAPRRFFIRRPAMGFLFSVQSSPCTVCSKTQYQRFKASNAFYPFKQKDTVERGIVRREEGRRGAAAEGGGYSA